MPISQLVLLLLGEPLEPVVPLAGRTRLVLVHAVEDAKEREAQRADLPAQVDGVAGEVFGGFGADVGPSVFALSVSTR